jgi:hypothetical protein
VYQYRNTTYLDYSNRCVARLKQLILKTLDKFNTGIGQLFDGIRWAINLRAATLTPYHHRLIGEFKISFEKHRQLANPGLN